MKTKPTLAVVGATGAVGTVMLDILTNREDVWGEIRLIASARSAGKQLMVRGRLETVIELTTESFEDVDVAMFDVPDEVSAIWAPIAASKGAIAVDNSGAFRMDSEVPLVVPEVNADQVKNRPKGIISNPNCTTLSMIVVIGALHQKYGVEELVVSSYQAASGAGQSGIDSLREQMQLVAGTEVGSVAGDHKNVIKDHGPFPASLALNVIPWAGSLKEDGYTSEELKVRKESQKILGLPNLKVIATCVRVPVITTHSLTVVARFKNKIDIDAARDLLRKSPGVTVLDDPRNKVFPTPADVVGTDDTWVGRLRASMDDENTLTFFVCGDNLRKGAALNTAQIAEVVAKEFNF